MPAKQQQGRRLTKENIETNSDAIAMSRKSVDDGPMPQTTQPAMRRSSRWDPQLIQMTNARRMSMVSRTSISGASQVTKPVKYENTFKMQPDRQFESHTARNVMFQTLKEWLTGVEYSPNVRRLTTGLTEEIKKRVKALGYHRYKYIVTVTITQDAKQSMQIVSRCMWNKETDTFAESTFKTGDIHAIATLFACYYE